MKGNFNWPVHLANMHAALELATQAAREGEVPVGAVIVDQSGQMVAGSYNKKEQQADPTGHGEIICLRAAGLALQNWRLLGCTLYVTLEPCLMCLGAMQHARISQLVFGAFDAKAGAISLGYSLFKDRRLNHNFAVIGGVEHHHCSRLLSDFFRQQRKKTSS